MRPPAPSTSPAISPTPRRSVPLNSMCSWKWARPRSSSRSSAEPARAQIWNSATGAVSVSWSSTVSPFGSCSQSTRRWLTIESSVPAARHSASRWTTSASTCTCRSASASARTATSRWSRRARSAREAEERYVAALLAELAARRGDFAGRSLATVYFGGGTPSLLAPRQRARAARRGARRVPGRARRGHARGESEHARARAAARVPRARASIASRSGSSRSTTPRCAGSAARTARARASARSPRAAPRASRASRST